MKTATDALFERSVDWVFGKNGALFHAASCGNADLVREIAEAGVDVNMASGKGFTPLHRAAQHGHADVVRILLELGAEPNATAQDRATPVSLASQNGHTDIAELLKKRQ